MKLLDPPLYMYEVLVHIDIIDFTIAANLSSTRPRFFAYLYNLYIAISEWTRISLKFFLDVYDTIGASEKCHFAFLILHKDKPVFHLLLLM